MAALRAAANHAEYGNYPFSNTFASNDNVPDLPDSAQETYSAAFDPTDGIKRHAACDECRKRKLKCSGEPSGCSRCVKQNLVCHYSEQKQMGRPRKRQKTEDEQHEVHIHVASPPKPIQPAPEPRNESQPAAAIDPSLAALDSERSQFENVCNGPVAQSIRTQRNVSLQDTPTTYSGHSDTSQSLNGPMTPETFDFTGANYPTDVAQWPDFSTLENLPLPVENKWDTADSETPRPFDPDADPSALSNLPSVPSCPCLPNLYLTLSTLSTLSSFPFTSHTIQTLETAHRTAKAVIYCNVCPQKFQSGSSNLMLSCTLLNVIADHWNRLRKLNTEELRKSFGKAGQQSGFPTTREGQQWRLFAEQLIRAYVFGDKPIPKPPTGSSTPVSPPSESEGDMAQVTLIGLVEALTRRQRQWHRLDEPTDEFPDRVTPELERGHDVGEHKDGEPRNLLCLEIIGHARCIVNRLDSDKHHAHH